MLHYCKYLLHQIKGGINFHLTFAIIKIKKNVYNKETNFYSLFGVISAVLSFTSCVSDPTPLEKALDSAGNNRTELEKVLKHYQNDSLKLRAAEFLIENMPFHYSYSGKELEKYHKYFKCFPP